MVGAAGIEPATAGLEILPRRVFRLYSCVFPGVSADPLAHSVRFGYDLSEPNGHECGHEVFIDSRRKLLAKVDLFPNKLVLLNHFTEL